MSLITIAEYKAYPYYNSSQTDAHINIYLQDVENDYLSIRNSPWETLTVDTTNLSATLEAQEVLSKYVNGQWKELYQIGQRLYGTGVTDGTYITAIDFDEEELTMSANATATGEDIELIVYPLGSKSIAAKMIRYQFDSQYRDHNLKSESIEKHSMTFADGGSGEMINGYPISIVGNIKRYASTG